MRMFFKQIDPGQLLECVFMGIEVTLLGRIETESVVRLKIFELCVCVCFNERGHLFAFVEFPPI